MNESPTAEAAQASPAAIGGRRLTIGLYIAAAFLYWASLYLYVPTLPTYAQSKTESLALVGVILSMYGLWQAIIRLPLGIVADWLGRRKPFIIAGFVLAGLGAWAMGTAGDANGLLVGRAITGLAAGTWVPLVVVFSSLYPPEEAVRASAALTLVSSIARMLATSVTGSLNGWGGYPLAFYLAAGAAGLAILVVLPARESRRPVRLPSATGIGSLVIRRDVLLPSLLNTVGQYANWATTFGFLPILAKRLGATDVTQSILVTLSIGMIIVGNLLATTIVRRIGARQMVYLNFVLMAAGVGAAALASDLWLIFVAQICIGLSQGIGYPVLMGMSIQHVADAERATAMGLHQAVYAIGMFGGPWLSGILADAIGIQPMFGVTAAACLVLGVLGTYWLSEGKEER
jgi:MFS family permease